MKRYALVIIGLALGWGIAHAEANQAQINALQARVQELQVALGIIEPPVRFCGDFERTLRYGDRGEEVERLQIALQLEGYGISEQEAQDKAFGVSTRDAVARFQEANAAWILHPNNLTKGTGVFGSYSRLAMREKFGCLMVRPDKPGAIAISTISPLQGRKKEYLFAVFKGTGGSPIYAWNITKGSLPPGVVLASPLDLEQCAGVDCQTRPSWTSVWLQGTPQRAGTYPFELTVTDSAGVSSARSFAIIIRAPAKEAQYVEYQ
jgi:hypothetical protein